jgi:hypothetical protein
LGSGAECGQYFWKGGGGQGEKEENSGEDAGDFARLAGVNEAVAEDGDGGDTKDGAMDGADATENAGAAKNDSGNGIEFVAGSGVSFGLSKAGGVDNSSKGRDKACEDIGQADSAFDGNSCIASAFRGEADCAEGASESRSVNEDQDNDEDEDENWSLGGNAEEPFLAEEKKPGWEVCEGVYAMSDGFGQTAKKRVSAKCHDEWWKAEQSDKRSVEAASEGADAKGEDDGERNGNVGVAPEFAEEDGAEAEQRADGEIDAASEYDGCHHQGEKADFDGVTEDIAGVVVRGEAAADCVEVEPFEDEDEEQNGFVAENG